MENNEDVFKLLNRHKRNVSCDLCRKRIWFFQKGVRFVIRTKDNVWIEYYHVKCLAKRGLIRKIKPQRDTADRDNKDPQGTNNVVH